MAVPNALLVIIRHAPHSSNWLREGLDAALVAAAFGQPVHLLFMGQGIMALLKEQGSGAPGQKATLPTIDMLGMYDIEQLWVPEGTLKIMQLSTDSLVEGATLVADQEIPKLMQQHATILNF
ncbi:MAG: sulfurtransferase complex subunit TusC [Halomonas sp.]|uniref:sulfurtransferase complex subunit TusC n=1 Tax=unclassified Halomonas TaxID=2609666 RepID=UPI00264CF2E7|nr:sulfurtransferase complex subunit TusC [Halomonas sp.]